MTRLMTLTSVLLVLVVIAVPALMGRNCNAGQGLLAQPPGTVAYSTATDLKVNVWFPDAKQVREMPLEEYLLGVVAAEMGQGFELEALKSQFIAARSYTVRRMHQLGGDGCPSVATADVCASPETGQAYTSLETLKAKVGALAAGRYWHRLQEARDATRGLIMTYHGAVIDAVYHSSSGTVTESALEYYGHDIPYLQSVPDPYGKEAPNWETTESFTRTELAADFKGLAVPASTGGSLAAVVRMTQSGRVSEVRVGDTVMTGRQFREKLGLRSTQFTLQWKDGKLTITTRGYGHGVGMSQWGANGMAKHGATYAEILQHYYQGVKIEPIFSE